MGLSGHKHKKKGPRLFEPKELTQDMDFASVVGRIRVAEEAFLGPEDIHFLSDKSGTYHERLDILHRAGYEGEGTFEDVILRDRDRQDWVLSGLVGDTKLDLFLLLDLDYHNLKAILRYQKLEAIRLNVDTAGLYEEETSQEGKAIDLPKSVRPLIRFTSPTDPQVLFEFILQNTRERENMEPELRPMFQDHVCQVLNLARVAADLSQVDLLADRLYFEELWALTEDKANRHMKPILQDYVMMLADQANFESYFRLRKSNRSKAYFEKVVVPHGYITWEDFSRAYGKEEEIEELFYASPISETFESFPPYETGQDISNYGLNSDLLLCKLIGLGKHENMHAVAVMSYWLAKKMERKNLRICHQILSRNLDPEKMRGMFRPTYPEMGL